MAEPTPTTATTAGGVHTDSVHTGGVHTGNEPSAVLAGGGGPPATRFALLALGAILAVGLAAFAGSQTLSWTTGQERHDQRVVLPASVNRLEVHVSSGNLSLTGAGSGPAVVDAHLSGTVHPPKLTVQIVGGTAKVTAHCGWHYLLRCGADLRLTVPPNVTSVARTSSGDIRAADLRGPMDLASSSGDIVTSGGTGPARLSTGSGDVRASGLRATSVSAHSSSGDVSLRLAVVPDTVSATTSSGDARITVPNDPTAYLVAAHASSGDERVRVHTDPTSQHRITVRSGSGDVSVGYVTG
jgi:hypothetical protein